MENNKHGVPYDRPAIVNVGEARDAIGDAINAAIEGKDVKAAAEKSNTAFQDHSRQRITATGMMISDWKRIFVLIAIGNHPSLFIYHIDSRRKGESRMLYWIDKNVKWIYPLPAILFVGLMMVFPIGYTFWLSFHDWSMSNVTPPLWVALENYTSLFKDELFRKSL